MSSNQELIDVISIIADDKNIRVTVEEAGKGALICGVSALVGGLLMGPRGLAIGSAIGGAAAYASSGSFRSLGDVLLNDLSNGQKQRLVQLVRNAANRTGVLNMSTLLGLLTNDSSIQEIVLNVVKEFATSELSLQIID